jgi:hypothetical protein
VCTPVEVQPTGGADRPPEEHKAIIRDISASGACFLTRVELEEGDRLNLSIQLSREADSVVETSARVVRVEVFEPERADVWTCQIAVEFDRALEGHDEQIEDLAERLKRAGLPW